MKIGVVWLQTYNRVGKLVNQSWRGEKPANDEMIVLKLIIIIKTKIKAKNGIKIIPLYTQLFWVNAHHTFGTKISAEAFGYQSWSYFVSAAPSIIIAAWSALCNCHLGCGIIEFHQTFKILCIAHCYSGWFTAQKSKVYSQRVSKKLRSTLVLQEVHSGQGTTLWFVCTGLILWMCSHQQRWEGRRSRRCSWTPQPTSASPPRSPCRTPTAPSCLHI